MQEYLKALNAFRTSLPQSLSCINLPESEVKLEVQEVTTVFHNLLNHANKLNSHYSLIYNKYCFYLESLEKAKSWIFEATKSSKKALEEPVAEEPHLVQEQLDKMKLINIEVVGEGRLVENVSKAVSNLTETLNSCNVISTEMKSIESEMDTLQNDYSELMNSITSRINALQTAVIHSQDIQDSLDRIHKLLGETENAVKLQKRPVSLVIEKLDEQVIYFFYTFSFSKLCDFP